VPVFALVASVLLLVAVVAMLGPARRAAGVSPMQALRVD
jgi:ABC-type antimicrobial peptide transport system permease subunit